MKNRAAGRPAGRSTRRCAAADPPPDAPTTRTDHTHKASKQASKQTNKQATNQPSGVARRRPSPPCGSTAGFRPLVWLHACALAGDCRVRVRACVRGAPPEWGGAVQATHGDVVAHGRQVEGGLPAFVFSVDAAGEDEQVVHGLSTAGKETADPIRSDPIRSDPIRSEGSRLRHS